MHKFGVWSYDGQYAQYRRITITDCPLLNHGLVLLEEKRTFTLPEGVVVPVPLSMEMQR